MSLIKIVNSDVFRESSDTRNKTHVYPELFGEQANGQAWHHIALIGLIDIRPGQIVRFTEKYTTYWNWNAFTSVGKTNVFIYGLEDSIVNNIQDV